MTFTELFQQCLDMNSQERINAGANAVNKLMAFLKQTINDEELAVKTLLTAVSVYAGGDNKLTDREADFIKGIFGLNNWDNDKLFNLVNSFVSVENLNFINELIDSCPNDIKTTFVMLAILTTCSDGTMTVDEKRLVALLLD